MIHLISGTFSQILGLINSFVVTMPSNYPNDSSTLWVNIILFIIGSLPIIPILALEIIFRVRTYYYCKSVRTLSIRFY